MNSLLKRILNKLERELMNPYRTFMASKELKRLICMKGENDAYVLLSRLFGDICYGMAYLNAFSRQMVKKGFCVTVFVTEKQKDLVSSYNHNNYKIVYLNSKDRHLVRMQWILQRIQFKEKALQNNIFITVPNYLVDLKTNQRDGLDILRNDVFRIGNNIEIEFPNIPDKKITAIDNFYELKNRIVVVNPYSNSIDINIHVFEEISSCLKDKGYIVYTNVVGDQKPIEGTLPLYCSIFEFYNICKEIPFVVSIRSGIIDFAISAKNSNFFIIHFVHGWGVQAFYNVWRLSAWNTNNTIEFIYRDNGDTINKLNVFIEKTSNRCIQ